MRILAVDTTGESLSVALRAGPKTFGQTRKFTKPHDETLLPAIDRLLKKAGLKLADLDAIAAASGPGRFTGIRIGMAYASVAAARLKIPALAVSRFEAAAFRAASGKFCAVIEGFRDEKYYQLFDRKGGALLASDKPQWIGGHAWLEVRKSLEKTGTAILEADPRAEDLLGPAAFYLSRAKRSLPSFEPLYLKPAGYMLGKKK